MTGSMQISPTEHIAGSFEHKPDGLRSFLNGSRGLKFYTLHSVSDSLSRVAASFLKTTLATHPVLMGSVY